VNSHISEKTPQSVRIRTGDGLELAASRFPAANEERVALINSATGVPRQFYHRFCAYLAENSITAYCYDYRGIGDSRPGRLRGFSASMTDWATRDASAVLDYLKTAHPGRRITWIGHSFGGQILGLIPPPAGVDRVLLVGSQLPSYLTYSYPMRLVVLLFWGVLIPLLTPVFGYFPSRFFGMGESLPAGVAFEWARWGLSRNYMLDHVGSENFQPGPSAKAVFFVVRDDLLAPLSSIHRLREALSAMDSSTVDINPADIGQGAIGHMGIFRKKFKDSLWPRMLAAARLQAPLVASDIL